MTRVPALAIACLVAAAAAADDKGEPAPTDLDGVWKVVSWEANGMPADADAIAGLVVTVEGERLSFRGKRFHPQVWGVRLDPAKAPKEIDVVLRDEGGAALLKGKDGKPVAALGIYKLEGGRLTVCIREPDPAARRPAEFKAARGAGGSWTALFVLERTETKAASGPGGCGGPGRLGRTHGTGPRRGVGWGCRGRRRAGGRGPGR